jgi:hypothetical protein
MGAVQVRSLRPVLIEQRNPRRISKKKRVAKALPRKRAQKRNRQLPLLAVKQRNLRPRRAKANAPEPKSVAVAAVELLGNAGKIGTTNNEVRLAERCFSAVPLPFLSWLEVLAVDRWRLRRIYAS